MVASIKVAYGHIDVVGLGPHDADEQGIDGSFSSRRHRIEIREDLPPAEQAKVLMHEIIHACFECFNLPHEKLDEERICLALDGPLTTVFTDNPWLIGVLHQAVTNGSRIV
jgi:hypothetical protein